MHDNTNHVFIIQDGEAEFVTGGKMIEGKVIEAGQTRGTVIEGGASHHLVKGDVITIPAKTPHQWKDTSKTGSVGYFAVNFDRNLPHGGCRFVPPTHRIRMHRPPLPN